MKKYKKILSVILILFIVLSGACAAYFLDYYHPDDTAITCLENETEGVTITRDDKGNIVFMPDDPQAGFIFYPGAKVDARSYAPLLCSLAKEGICCVDLPMLCNFPFFSMNAADGIVEQYPEITKWYIGGHSLGGLVSAMYLSKHTEDFSGIILFASYSVSDLSDTELSALSVYGENDGVMNRDNFEKDESNLPRDHIVVCIPGGCHAGFGDYGAQKGDGEPAIPSSRQQEITVETIREWIGINE